jgi:transposase InsO family protein
VLGQHRSTQRKAPRGREDEGRLVADIIELTRQYGRYGYRKIAALLRQAGWLVNDKRVERIWRCEGLKVPTKQPKRGRLWLNDGSCVRLRAERPNHVWSYDFVEDRTHEGKKYRMLNVVDEFTRECLSIRVNRRLNSTDVIDVLSDLFILRGVPEHIRSDNGPEFVAKAVQKWIYAVGAKTAYIAPGSPWENGYVLAEPSFAWTRALTPDCVTSFSTESFSTRLQRLGSSSRAGGGTITVSDLTHHSDTNHPRQKCSYPATPRGRLRSLKRLQRPHSP